VILTVVLCHKNC